MGKRPGDIFSAPTNYIGRDVMDYQGYRRQQ
jgi:hypothetical protein